MVQIIQSGPSQATLRQQALDEATRGIISGFQGLSQQRETERQRALQDLSTDLELQKAGIDATAQDYRDFLAGKYQPKVITPAQEAQPAVFGAGQISSPADLKRQDELGNVGQLLMSAPTPAKAALMGDINPLKNFTAAKRAQMEAAQDELAIDREQKQLGLEKGRLDIDLARQNAPLEAQKKMLELQKTMNDIALSPITRKKAEREIQKLEAETAKTLRESTAPANQQKLAKLSDTAKDKVAGVASGLKALSDIGVAIDKGFEPSRINPDTPIVGSFVSDTDLTAAQRRLNEAFGRIQSGGAIGVEEEKRFNAMGPRPGDTKDQMAKKIAAQKDFLLNKLQAFGLTEKDLAQSGFDLGQGSGGTRSQDLRLNASEIDIDAINKALSKRGVAVD